MGYVKEVPFQHNPTAFSLSARKLLAVKVGLTLALFHFKHRYELPFCTKVVRLCLLAARVSGNLCCVGRVP